MITRKSLADEFDAYDQSIADLNAGKKDTLDAYRDQLEAAGVAKANIKLEIEAVKAAIKRRRLVAKDAAAVEEKDALVDEVFAEITAVSRAPRATREIIEKFPPHDPETGELAEQESGGRGASIHLPAGSGSDEIPAPITHPQPTSQAVPQVAAIGEAGAPVAAASPLHSDRVHVMRKSAADYRPHCLDKANCAASGLSHCHRCARAAGEVAA